MIFILGLFFLLLNFRGGHGLGQPRKSGQSHPKTQKNGLGWVIGWVWFLKMENP